MTNHISREAFLGGAAALAVSAATAPLASARPAGPCGLTYRGVGYEVADGGYPATGWNAARMRDDMWAISGDLHANSVSVFGTGVERLAATSTEAAERGLHVWLQPRLADQPHDQILAHLAETGKHAERLRRGGAQVHLSVGCEFYLFVPGIVPGRNVLERIENLQTGNYDPQRMHRRLTEFIRRAARVGRSVFKGGLTYGAAQDDAVEWELFDIVGVDYYAYFPHRSGYVRDLRKYRRWHKPVAISEFGCCTYRSAPRRGGMGWDAVDYDHPEPQIKPGLVRSEAIQAEYLGGLLEVFESMNLYAAIAYEFVTPDAPHRRQRRYDLDIASYGLVKPNWQTHDRPTRHWHWEPKQAFHTLARHYARHRSI